MGYIKHDTVVVTSWDSKSLTRAREKAVEIYAKTFSKDSLNDLNLEETKEEFDKKGFVISPIIQGVANGQCSFLIAPDGSKEGWEPSNLSNEAREEFLNWLKTYEEELYCEYIHIRFGGDDSKENILRSNYIDRGEE